jgi:hypothetical protein
MMLLLPTQSEKEAIAEVAAIREAGKHIVASPERMREFLASLGFGVKRKGANVAPQKSGSKSIKRSA